MTYAIANFTASTHLWRQARTALLTLLAAETQPGVATTLATTLTKLDPAPDDQAHARAHVLALLTRQAQPEGTLELASTLTALSPTAADQDTARHHLLNLIASESNPAAAQHLVSAAVRLQPRASDLANPRQWAIPPSPAMLAAIRRNSPLTSWLASLPAL